MTSHTVESRSPVSGNLVSSRRSNRRPDIQGLRAIAVLMVVAFHAGLPVPGGFVGVDVFFVISGFVIAATLQREWDQSHGIRFARFYMRRLKRLTPALALMVTVTMLLTAVVISPLGAQQNAAKTAIGAMFIASNIVIANTTGGYFSLAAETNPLLNVWSLSVEEQFYLGFPFLLALGWAIVRRRRGLSAVPLILVGSIVLVSFLLALVDEGGLAFPGSKDALGFYSPLPRAWEFAAGAFIALAISGRRGLGPRTAAVSGTLGLAGLSASVLLISESDAVPGSVDPPPGRIDHAADRRRVAERRQLRESAAEHPADGADRRLVILDLPLALALHRARDDTVARHRLGAGAGRPRSDDPRSRVVPMGGAATANAHVQPSSLHGAGRRHDDPAGAVRRVRPHRVSRRLREPCHPELSASEPTSPRYCLRATRTWRSSRAPSTQMPPAHRSTW